MPWQKNVTTVEIVFDKLKYRQLWQKSINKIVICNKNNKNFSVLVCLKEASDIHTEFSGFSVLIF